MLTALLPCFGLSLGITTSGSHFKVDFMQTHAQSPAGLHALVEASVSWFKATSSGDVGASRFRGCRQVMWSFVSLLEFTFLIGMLGLCFGLLSV